METFSHVVLSLYESAKELSRADFLDHVSATVRRALCSSSCAASSASAIAVLLPHVQQAHAINRCIRSGAGEVDDTVTIGRWAAASPCGDVYLREDEFEALLQAEWPAWTHASLPYAILDIAVEPGPHVYCGRTIAIRVEAIADMIVLFASAKKVHHRLTPSECAVAAHIARGATYKEIARMLGMSPATVRNHLHAAYTKLGTHSRLVLARCAGVEMST